jgi:HK97 family phage portal protein
MNFWTELFSDQSPKVEVKSQFEDVLKRLVAAQEGNLSGSVSPDNCMASPTVHAIVTAISRRISVTPIHVYEKTSTPDGDIKELLPDHPVARLLQRPNKWQTRLDFWQDAASVFVRHGRFYAYKSRGSTGPIRELIPLPPTAVTPEQDENYNVKFRVVQGRGGAREYAPDKIFHARGPAKDFLTGDSPVNDIKLAIALEIMAEKFGASFFHNGALPLLVFNYLEGSSGFRDADQEKQFVNDFQAAFSGGKAHKALLLPKGLDSPSPIKIEHDKAQFIETRKYQRTVIAGAFGVPPHITGDLERATFNNVEQQDQDFTVNVVMPVAQAFEAAMERDLLTDADRRRGVIIRFNLDSILRADFKSRQEGLKMQREMGVINANEWREMEGKNPRDGGDEYWDEGPSGQNMGNDDEIESDDSA